MFIRLKKVKKRSGKSYEYAHLVRGVWKKRRLSVKIDKKRTFREYNNSIHKYCEFLGRVYRFQDKNNKTDDELLKNFENFVEKNPVGAIYLGLIEVELKQRGFKKDRGILNNNGVFVDLNRLIVHDGRSDVVIKMSNYGGCLCALTLTDLFNIKKISNKYEGVYLMKKLRMAGLKLTHEQFFVLADKLLRENNKSI